METVYLGIVIFLFMLVVFDFQDVSYVGVGGFCGLHGADL